jgi:hypothetical protein
VYSHSQKLIRAWEMMFDDDIFTGYILRNKRTSKRSPPMLSPSPYWWWSHCMCNFPLTALPPEIQICIITEQKCVERLHLFNIFIRSVIRNIQGVLQTSSKIKTPINGINLVKILYQLASDYQSLWSHSRMLVN